MDNKNNDLNTISKDMPTNVDTGRWVAVDQDVLGFALPSLPSNRPVAGPDGAIYCMGECAPEFRSVQSNANNVVPTPSSIVQMPAIVQPIALVPYTSQNQPMLQYDPYSRPVEPTGAPKAPVYVKKAYRKVSVAGLIIAVIAIILTLLLPVAVFQANDARIAFKLEGFGSILAIQDFFAEDFATDYGQNILASKGTLDILSKIVVYAFPVIVTVIALFFLILVLKYLIKFFKKDSPRSFSILAFLNVVLSLVAIAGLLLMANAELEAGIWSDIPAFLLGKTTVPIGLGYGLLAALLASIILLFVPLFAKKNAYIIERDDPSRKTYIIND